MTTTPSEARRGDEAFLQHQRERIEAAKRHDAEEAKPKLASEAMPVVAYLVENRFNTRAFYIESDARCFLHEDGGRLAPLVRQSAALSLLQSSQAKEAALEERVATIQREAIAFALEEAAKLCNKEAEAISVTDPHAALDAGICAGAIRSLSQRLVGEKGGESNG